MRRTLLVLGCLLGFHPELPGQWIDAGPSVPGSVVTLAADSRYVYIGTTRGHVWRRPLADFTTEVAAGESRRVNEVPGSGLASFPNPCNSSTVFTIKLPGASAARLSLFDILGRNVMTIVDARLEAGTHRVPVDLGSLASGSYVAVLTAGDVLLTGRLLLIR
jgi:hypothetical protein